MILLFITIITYHPVLLTLLVLGTYLPFFFSTDGPKKGQAAWSSWNRHSWCCRCPSISLASIHLTWETWGIAGDIFRKIEWIDIRFLWSFGFPNFSPKSRTNPWPIRLEKGEEVLRTWNPVLIRVYHSKYTGMGVNLVNFTTSRTCRTSWSGFLCGTESFR